MAEIIETEPEVSEAVFQRLVENESISVSCRDLPFYECENCYEEVEIDGRRHIAGWKEYQVMTKHSARFFSDAVVCQNSAESPYVLSAKAFVYSD